MGLRKIRGHLSSEQRRAVNDAIQALTDKRDRTELDDALTDLCRAHQRWNKLEAERLSGGVDANAYEIAGAQHGDALYRVLAFADETRETPAWTEACRAIAMERAKQRRMWKHDDEHTSGELVEIAVAYLTGDEKRVPYDWTFKPRGKRENLVRAAALIAAELDRIS